MGHEALHYRCVAFDFEIGGYPDSGIALRTEDANVTMRYLFSASDCAPNQPGAPDPAIPMNCNHTAAINHATYGQLWPVGHMV